MQMRPQDHDPANSYAVGRIAYLIFKPEPKMADPAPCKGFPLAFFSTLEQSLNRKDLKLVCWDHHAQDMITAQMSST